jgi:aminopeptidase N
MRRMPAPLSNLTQSEARERSRLVEGLSYFIEWDLTGDEARHPFQAQVEFTSSEPGAATFIDLEVAEVAEMIWNGAPLPGSAYDGQRIALPLLSSRNSLLVRGQAL